MRLQSAFKKFTISVAKFATSSAIATLVDFVLFLFVLSPILPIFWAEFFSGLAGMLINFFLQKRYVFTLRRNAYIAFALSLASSLIALLLGSYLMTYLVQIPLLAKYILLAKIIVVGSKFFFNYFTKRRIFERSRKKFGGGESDEKDLVS
jgi:putative flippase GtrA